jgi:hypothetical protein
MQSQVLLEFSAAFRQHALTKTAQLCHKTVAQGKPLPADEAVFRFITGWQHNNKSGDSVWTSDGDY